MKNKTISDAKQLLEVLTSTRKNSILLCSVTELYMKLLMQQTSVPITRGVPQDTWANMFITHRLAEQLPKIPQHPCVGQSPGVTMFRGWMQWSLSIFSSFLELKIIYLSLQSCFCASRYCVRGEEVMGCRCQWKGREFEKAVGWFSFEFVSFLSFKAL